MNITDAAEIASTNIEKVLEDTKNSINNINENLGSFVKTKRSAKEQISKYISNFGMYVGLLLSILIGIYI